MVATFAKVVVDGMTIRATKDPAPADVKGWIVSSIYPVEVDGELRGYLAYQAPGYHRQYEHKGWVLLSLRAHHGHRSPVQKSYQPKPAAVPWLLRKIPELIAQGALPNAADAEKAMRLEAEVERVGKELQARQAAERAEVEERRRIAWNERQATMLAGLESLHARQDLTNLERVALIEAFGRLHIKVP